MVHPARLARRTTCRRRYSRRRRAYRRRRASPQAPRHSFGPEAGIVREQVQTLHGIDVGTPMDQLQLVRRGRRWLQPLFWPRAKAKTLDQIARSANALGSKGMLGAKIVAQVL